MENKKKNIKISAIAGEIEKDNIKVVDSGELTIRKEKEQKSKEQDDLIV